MLGYIDGVCCLYRHIERMYLLLVDERVCCSSSLSREDRIDEVVVAAPVSPYREGVLLAE